MTLRLVTGRAGAGKSSFIRQEIAERCQVDPLGKAIFLIVPDQMTFTAEKSLSTSRGMHGIVRAQVSTFKRLAWRILQEVGGISKQEVSGYGYRMLLRKILEENRESLSLFRLAATKRGFTEQLEELLREMQRYCVETDVFLAMKDDVEKLDAPESLKQKLRDVALIMTEVEDRLGTTHVDSQGYVRLLQQSMHLSDELRDAEVYVDGFVSMTTRERELLGELMKCAKRVTIALPMEDVQADMSDEQSIFHTAAVTAEKLRALARENGIAIEETISLQGTTRFHSEDILHLERELHRYPAEERQATGDVSIIEAENRRAEVHAIARKIRGLVRDEGYRYRDIAILTRQTEIYDVLLRNTLPEYDIPLFVNEKRPMLHHPLLEWARSVMEVVTSNYAYEPVMRALKTDLFIPKGANRTVWRERIDVLENFLLAHGIYGDRWGDDKRWFVKRYRGLEFHTSLQTDEERAMQADIEEVKATFYPYIEALKEKLTEGATGKDVATALFEMASDLQLYEKLIDRKDEDEANHLLIEAGDHEQAWNAWITVLDQFVLLFGEEKKPLEEFVALLEEGFDQLEFSRIPPSVDQVSVGTVDLSRLSNVKAAFVIGVNDGVFPKRVEQDGLLSDADREWLSQLGVELAPTSKMRLMDEQYVMYRAVSTASHRLYFSYPLADEEGKALLPSTYIKRMQQLLHGLPFETAVIQPAELSTNALNYFEHARTSIAYIASRMREETWQEDSNGEWAALASYLEADPLWRDTLAFVTKPLREDRQAEKLPEETTTALYGETISSSVSRVEKYFNCAFAHFAAYGLRLSEREEYRLEAPAIGDLFHEALKWIGNETKRLNRSWASLSTEEAWELARQAVDAISPYFVHQILLSTKRHLYIQRKLVQILQRTMRTLKEHAKVSNFQPVAIEAGFGFGEQLPPLELQLQHGKKIRLRGRIDRIDAHKIGDKTYLRIVDYKSSAKKLDIADVYYGLSLQMLTYLDVATSHAKELLSVEADPAGVLYVHVHNPMLAVTQEAKEDVVEEDVLKKFKMRGLLIDNVDVLREMDTELAGHSTIIPAYVKTDDTLSYHSSSVVSTEDMEHLRTFTRKKHQQAGEEMLAGNTAVLPARIKNKTACDYCQFRSVCQFDPTDPHQHYRSLAPLKDEDATAKIRKEVRTRDDSN
ncbi:helicase-exonuclease AddAB subunit AddB [Paenisporosarcina cavernae]|uniref:ATP-dependent helicase/deoxyribonuclease subunit B n=1 Tax=Paenisporosarcina cavernae TaxID=2320858 RepID=A0A385YR78_9BACL|nr:helicase-exonuclease AddAB subunit AddB [Paenisporosarcina cavernae]AYC28994.1 helicase-exonuclease AddAB subunit AddB [Paenisporosarcina cavernae]